MDKNIISIIGLGYVGLPLALLAASKNNHVVGVDKNIRLLESITDKDPFVCDDIVIELIQKTDLETSSEVTSSSTYIICVPTPVTKNNEPDLKYVVKAAEEIASVIKDDQLVIIESTINPGVSREIVKPVLDESGKRYHLAHCPERINPGDKKWNVKNIPRVVGGIDSISAEKAAEIYKKIIDAEITVVSQIEAAEATKILENTFRDVNIAFINEMAMSFHKLGIDIKEVIRGASTKPFAFLPHYPGVGVGGHCIAVDPYYMIQKGKEEGFIHDFLIAARRINSEMPKFTVDVLQDALNDVGLPIKGTKIGMLGISYKPNINDNRESPYYDVLKILEDKGAVIYSFDPYFPEQSSELELSEILNETEAVIIITAHDEFLFPEQYGNLKVVVDGRNCLDKTYFRSDNAPLYRGIGIPE